MCSAQPRYDNLVVAAQDVLDCFAVTPIGFQACYLPGNELNRYATALIQSSD